VEVRGIGTYRGLTMKANGSLRHCFEAVTGSLICSKIGISSLFRIN
jgi:hypothetical protein